MADSRIKLHADDEFGTSFEPWLRDPKKPNVQVTIKVTIPATIDGRPIDLRISLAGGNVALSEPEEVSRDLVFAMADLEAAVAILKRPGGPIT